MGRRANTYIFCGSVLAATLSIGLAVREPEPSYGGNTLTHWATVIYMDWSRGPGKQLPPSPQGVQAKLALRAIGAKAIPSLLRWVRWQEATWQPSARRAIARLPVSADTRHRMVSILDRGLFQHRIVPVVFATLGPEAAAAIPELSRLADDPTAQVSGCAIECLAALGPDAIPAILHVATNPAHQFRVAAISSLGYYGPAPKSVIPALQPGLFDTNSLVVEATRHAIGRIDSGTPATPPTK